MKAMRLHYKLFPKERKWTAVLLKVKALVVVLLVLAQCLKTFGVVEGRAGEVMGVGGNLVMALINLMI